jgi:hypothetical protein
MDWATAIILFGSLFLMARQIDNLRNDVYDLKDEIFNILKIKYDIRNNFNFNRVVSWSNYFWSFIKFFLF